VPRLEGSKGDKDIVERIRRKLNAADPRRNDDGLYLNREKGRFEYERIRTFAEDSAPMTQGWRYLALSLFDPNTVSNGAGGGKETHSRLKSTGQGKAAYYYEIGQRMRLKADRVKTLAQARAQGGQAGKMAAVANENSVDGVDVLIREPDEDEVLLRAEMRGLLDGVLEGGKELSRLRGRAEERAAAAVVAGEGRENADGHDEADVDGGLHGVEKAESTARPNGLAGQNQNQNQNQNRRQHQPRDGTAARPRAEPADVDMPDADADADADGDADDD